MRPVAVQRGRKDTAQKASARFWHCTIFRGWDKMCVSKRGQIHCVSRHSGVLRLQEKTPKHHRRNELAMLGTTQNP